MPPPIPSPRDPRAPSGAVIAVVGSDGAGKSTLARDLAARLAARRPAELHYLGQDSGNILAAIVRVPWAGPAIGRFLKARSRRAHGAGGAPAAPDLKSALVIHLLSRWRFHKFARMRARAAGGAVIVADRYPQAETQGFWFDGPGLDASPAAGAEPPGGAMRALAAAEARLYRRMAAHVPALVIRLDIDPATAHARKPDHALAMLRDKARVIPALTFNRAPLVAIDARRPYAEVLAAALAAADAALAR